MPKYFPSLVPFGSSSVGGFLLSIKFVVVRKPQRNFPADAQPSDCLSQKASI